MSIYVKSIIDNTVYEFDYDVSTTIDDLSIRLSAKSGLKVWDDDYSPSCKYYYEWCE